MTKPTSLVSLFDWERSEIEEVLALAATMKRDPGAYRHALSGKSLAMIFEKSSTRTRVSFEVGMTQLGGHALFLHSGTTQMGRGEPIKDTAAVLSRYVDCIMARTFSHQAVVELAEHATVPVINGLTDYSHPCQILADFQTIEEHLGRLRGVTLAYVGDGNNVAHSLIVGAAKVGMNVRVAAPEGYWPDAALVSRAKSLKTAAEVTITADPIAAVTGANVVYTDVWASMGQEEEQQKRVAAFAGFQVNDALWAHTTKGAIFLHCLPAHRGEEVSASVCDGPQSVIYDEAENRLHAQKALMVYLMGD